MGLNHSPRIVTSGLVMCLDAANIKSYPGSGNTWFDISGNGNDVTLFNSPTFSNNALVFNGSNTYGVTVNNLDLSTSDKISIFINTKTTATTTQMILEHSTNFNSFNSFGALTGPDNNPVGTIEFVDRNQGYNVLYTSNTVNDGNWFTFAATSDRSLDGNSQGLVYRNGALNSTLSPTLRTDNSGNYGSYKLYIGSRAGTILYYAGAISNIMIYNRVLTPTEIQQNFNAFRGRFGL